VQIGAADSPESHAHDELPSPRLARVHFFDAQIMGRVNYQAFASGAHAPEYTDPSAEMLRM
jgi:hypothetical protein